MTADVDMATLALRMGIAANAIGAAQRFYWFVRDASGPAGERDRFWAFLIAIGFLHEAIYKVLRPSFPRIRDLAIAGGAAEQMIEEAGQLLSGKLALNKTMSRMRNKLICHWDTDVIKEYASAFSDSEVLWAYGVGNTNGEAVFEAAANALVHSVLPEEPGTDEAGDDERFGELIRNATPAMQLVVDLFNRAILGHIMAFRSELRDMPGA